MSKQSSPPDPLEPFRADSAGRDLTTNQGLPVADNQNSLRAGTRGPTALEDFIMREKITHFDHERIPERVVHARGAGAHGYFEAYESMAPYTRAHFLSAPGLRTPVFARFSTVGGSRGSADTPRDVRGFAVKFYTEQGNYDLVGNNMPVFFIQDAIKFPDFVHAVKPEPHNEIPQASSAHDTFWDFVSLATESTHTVMWLMSDRAIPKSFRTMEGFGVHTFRLINAAGEARYVKFHWKPLLGAHSLVWDEAQKLAGKDPDFNRRDLFEAIDGGDFPEWELGMQMFGDDEADSFGFDILDPTKLIPEELVPVKRIGKMTLNRNPDNYFAETEQVAFCVSHLVPGIDFTNDPLLQGRAFSYLDTQLSRLGGTNFHEIPINRPVCPFANGQRDGLHRMRIDVGNTAYDPNSLDAGWPKEKRVEDGGFATRPERVDGTLRRIRSETFADHFSQATLFWNSMSRVEQEHIVSAFSFELTKVTRREVRERVLERMLANVDETLAAAVAGNLGMPAPARQIRNGTRNGSGEARNGGIERSPALSLVNPAVGVFASAKTRKVAILASTDGDAAAIASLVDELDKGGVRAVIIGRALGTIGGGKGSAKGIAIEQTAITMPSIAFDGVVIAGADAAAPGDGDAHHFVAEAFKHAKPVAAMGGGERVLAEAGIGNGGDDDDGLIVGKSAGDVVPRLLGALAKHRVWSRETAAVPA
jgi:catalase